MISRRVTSGEGRWVVEWWVTVKDRGNLGFLARVYDRLRAYRIRVLPGCCC